MKNEKGFSLVELLIVVAIIAIIAAIAVPSLLTARMAANEASALQGLRTVGSAEIAFAATQNQQYTNMTSLTAGNYLDSRFTGTGYINGYTYMTKSFVLKLWRPGLPFRPAPPLEARLEKLPNADFYTACEKGGRSSCRPFVFSARYPYRRPSDSASSRTRTESRPRKTTAVPKAIARHVTLRPA